MRFLLGCLFTVFLICAVVAGVAKFGLYPVNADADPSWLERRLSHWAVDGYVESQAKMLPENPLKPTEAILMEGMKAFKSNCAGCHGETGLSSNPAWPKLAAQKPGYLVNVLKAFRAGLRKDPMMAGVSMGLSDTDIANLAAYYAAQSCQPTTQERKAP